MDAHAFTSRVLVLGCGNALAGDDAAGPRVIDLLAGRPELPPDVVLLNAGTAIQDLLLDLAVADARPQRLVIVDATLAENRAAGEVWEVDLAAGPKGAATDLHAFPALTELAMLRSALGVEVRVVAVQAGRIPVIPAEGLTPEVEAALPGAAGLVLAICREP
ncbi:MAG: hydrogenase maturation protease [Thermodesulfobacteriota bacterium]